MKKVKHPHPPRFLCNNILEWAFGIVSPSRLMYFTFGGGTKQEREKMEQYNAGVRAYQAYLWAQRVEARKVTKEEWRRHYRVQRLQRAAEKD